MKTILIIDDDSTTQSILKNLLQKEFNVIGVTKLADAEKALSQDLTPDLIVIDRCLPDGDGLSICANLRAQMKTQSVPIIFLSGLTSETDKVTGLFAGADDYISKPFSLLEFKARIHARLRESKKQLSIGNLVLDLDSQRAYKTQNEELLEIDLTRTEFKILLILAQNPDRVFSRDDLITKVWGSQANLSDRVVDTHMSHLRKKTQGAQVVLESLRGEGYRLLAA